MKIKTNETTEVVEEVEETLETPVTFGLTRLVGSGDEPHIIINDDRSIVVPDELKNIAVQFDHNIETVTFDCPRYWDSHDFSMMHIYVAYLCSDKSVGQFLCTNVVVDDADPDRIHFNWTISQNVTKVSGKISFIVCIKEPQADGTVVRHWNSIVCQDMNIVAIPTELEQPGNDIVIEPDIVEQILLRIEALENNSGSGGSGGVNEDEVRGIIEDYMTENPPTVDLTDYAKTEDVETLSEAIADLQNKTPSDASGLTVGQIQALDGMFKIASYTEDPTAAYSAFKAAFGIEDTGEEEPDEPDTPTVTLTSISATYSGGDVAVGTALTDLTGITVTVTYSDGSTAAVTDYTLSGEIAEGSNTITVSYNGKTTTFVVIGVAESTGENNGWVEDEAYAIEWMDGYKLDNSTGAETENASCSVSGFIPCLGVSALTGASISGGYLYAYDADKNYLGRIIFNASYPSPVNREVAYVKFYCNTSSKDTVSLIPHVYEEMTETTNWESGKYYRASYVEDTKLDANTGNTSTHTSNWTSGFMFCYGASSIVTTQIVSTSWGNKMAFYDADKNYISGATGNKIPWEVPENAVYFRLNGLDGFEYGIQKPNRPWIQLA
jgi:hypothetical protein